LCTDGTGETTPVVVEQLPVVAKLSAFAGAIDKIAKARPTMTSDEIFMASSQIPGHLPNAAVRVRIIL
jgi:hypothetical protein